METKTDRTLLHLEDESKKNEQRFVAVTAKLDKIEQRIMTTEHRLNGVEHRTDIITDAFEELAVEVNMLQENKLSKNCMISGIPEKKKTSDNDLIALILQILGSMTDELTATNVSYCGRVDKSNDNGGRGTLVKFKSEEAKQIVMCAKKKEDSQL